MTIREVLDKLVPVRCNCLCRWEVTHLPSTQCLGTDIWNGPPTLTMQITSPSMGLAVSESTVGGSDGRSCIHRLRGTCSRRCRCDSSALLARRHDEVSWTPRSTNVTMAQAQVLLSSHTDRVADGSFILHHRRQFVSIFDRLCLTGVL